MRTTPGTRTMTGAHRSGRRARSEGPQHRGRQRRRLPAAWVPLLVVAGLVTVAAIARPIGFPTRLAEAGADGVGAEEVGGAVLDRILKDPAITESSGLARSTYDSSILWTHDDSGDTNRVFGIDGEGRTSAVLTLGGAEARDWEDISTGPDHTLWVGDIGDNAVRRPSIQVYRLVEPKHPETSTVDAERFDLVYPDRPHNAETLMVHPTTGRVYVVTKDPEGGTIYAAPARLSPEGSNVLTAVGSAPAGVTAGAFAPDGESYTLRLHGRSLTYPGLPARGFAATEPAAHGLPEMRQGESLEYDATGRFVYVGTEGADSPVYRTAVPEPGTAPEPTTPATPGTPTTPSPTSPATTPSAPPPSTSTPAPTTPAPQPGTAVNLGWSPARAAVPTGGVVRPEDYGATGDGVTDDSAALQKALDAAAASDRKVQLAADRTYLAEKALRLPSNTYLYGAGPTSVLRYTWSRYDDAHRTPVLNNRSPAQGNSDITLDNFAVRGPWSGLPAGPKSIQPAQLMPSIRMQGVRRFVISRMDVGYTAGISMINIGSSDGLITNNHVHHSGRDGINTTRGHHVLVTDNLIEKVGDDGIAMLSGLRTDDFSTEVAAVGNTINGWESNVNGLAIGRGIALIGVRGVVIARNKVTRTHSYGIALTPSHTPGSETVWRNSDVTISDNVVIDAGQNYPGTDPRIGEPGHHGIVLKNSDDVLVSGNTVTNPYDKAIHTYECGCTLR